jgi:hypothetical protein
MTRITGRPGCISSLVGFDNITGLSDGTYALLQEGGVNGTVTMTGGAISSFNPGYGYSAGIASIDGGTRFTINSVQNAGVRLTSSVLGTSPTGTNIANDGTFGVFRPNDSNWGSTVDVGWNVVGHPELGKVVSVNCDLGDQYSTAITTTANNFVYGTNYSFEKRSGIRFGGASAGPSLFTPTGTPTQMFAGAADFEMGAYAPFIDPALVPDLSGNGHGMGLNDNGSGNANWYHFYNTSAQANDWTWPTVPGSTLAIMGWFAFASFNPSGTTSLVTRTSGGPNGWALRVDSAGAEINLVKYGFDDQPITLNTPLTTNTWHYISVAQNGTSMAFNIDGTSYSRSGNPGLFNDDGGAPVRLQYDPYTGGNQNIEMWMRDVKIISSNALDAAALLALWNTQKADYGY